MNNAGQYSRNDPQAGQYPKNASHFAKTLQAGRFLPLPIPHHQWSHVATILVFIDLPLIGDP